MTSLPLVTVIIPMLDEASDIEACLAAVLDQDYSLAQLEVIVVDGGSSDDSVDRAEQVLAAAPLGAWQMLHNTARTTPSSLNLGLAAATGDVLCRVDARTLVQRDHVRLCVEKLTDEPDVVVVGGSQTAVPRGPDSRSHGIARALNNRLSMGGAAYRSGGASRPTDTVYLGSFRTEELRSAGGWDERFSTNQDFELNRRMARTGVVWFDEGISSGYAPRASLGALWHQYHRFGRWKVRYWRTTGDPPVFRQRVILGLPLVPLLVALFLAVRRPSALLPFAGACAAGLVAVDVAGADRCPKVAVRAWALIAIVATSGGWWTGVVREALASGHRGQRGGR